MRRLESSFGDVEVTRDSEGRNRWRRRLTDMREALTPTVEELAALEAALQNAHARSQDAEHAALLSLSEKIRALIPAAHARRLDPDFEAILEAQGYAARPGPRAAANPEIEHEISTALKKGVRLEIEYRSRRDETSRKRRLDPYGVLIGRRKYLIGRYSNAPEGPIRSFVFENIESAIPLDDIALRPDDFDIHAYAKRSFGTYHNDEEYGEVVWRFKPAAANHARKYQFQPDQIFEDQDDGSVIVRFCASGHLEMCWHLYAWGEKVDVLAPEKLRDMISGYERDDFGALP